MADRFLFIRPGESKEIQFDPDVPVTSRVVHWYTENQGMRTKWKERPCALTDCEDCLSGQRPQVRFRTGVIDLLGRATIDMHVDLYKLMLKRKEKAGMEFFSTRFVVARTPGMPHLAQWDLEVKR
jgi:hypothetical protein